MTADSPVTGKFSAAKTALILLFLLVIWVAFIALPVPQETIKIVPFRESPQASKLRAVGLPDNPDLGGLPEIFAIWADQAEWKDGKTKFAYWHPGTGTYAYYFEASRVGGKIRFTAIGEPQGPEYSQDESLGEDCPIRFYRGLERKTARPQIHAVTDPTVIKPNLEAPGIEVVKPELPLPNAQPKR